MEERLAEVSSASSLAEVKIRLMQSINSRLVENEIQCIMS